MSNPTAYTTTVAKPPRIEGVKTKSLRVVPDDRGWLMEILRADDPELFTRFGQVYLSATYPGAVKAWHYHKQQVDNFACVAGMVKLVLRGSGDLARVELDPSLMAPGEGDVVADLMIAAHADAKRKLDAAQGELMREAAGPLAGLNIPGMPKF